MIGTTTENSWPCACVRRDTGTNKMNTIRLHHVSKTKCNDCGAIRPTLDKYYCSGCDRMLNRPDEHKKIISSYCETAGRQVRCHRY